MQVSPGVGATAILIGGATNGLAAITVAEPQVNGVLGMAGLAATVASLAAPALGAPASVQGWMHLGGAFGLGLAATTIGAMAIAAGRDQD